MPAMMVPELKGNPILLMKNISEALKNFKVIGNNNLKIKSKIATITKLATMKFLIVTVL